MDEERPLCNCHGVAMLRNGKNPSGTVVWRCIVRRREIVRRWRKSNGEKVNEDKRRWDAANPEKKRRMNARRLVVGGIYCGMVGFTEKQIRGIVDGSSD